MGLAEFVNSPNGNMLVTGLVVLVGAIVSVVAFVLLIPLESSTVATGVSIIIGVSYALAALMWVTVMVFYSRNTESLIWLNTHLIFLVLLPATIAATAMNVASVQNTRNMLAGKVST